MACCKKSTIRRPEIQVDENIQFHLRQQITYSQLATINPIFDTRMVNDNLVLQFLKENPNRISLFEKFPENWKELIAGPAQEERTEVQPDNRKKKAKR